LALASYADEKAFAADVNADIREALLEKQQEQQETPSLSEIDERMVQTQAQVEALLDEIQALKQEITEVDQKIDDVNKRLPALTARTQRLDALNQQVQEEIDKNAPIHQTTKALLQTPTSSRDATHLQSMETHLADIQAEISRLEGLHVDYHKIDFMSLDSDALSDVQTAQTALDLQIADLQEDSEMLDHAIKREDKKEAIATFKREFEYLDDDGMTVPVLPALPPDMMQERVEAIRDMFEDMLEKTDRDFLGKGKESEAERLHALEVLGWLDETHNHYDEKGQRVEEQDKHAKTFIMLPHSKHVLVLDEQIYIVDKHVKTTEDLMALDQSARDDARKEANKASCHPASKQCQLHLNSAKLDQAKELSKLDGLMAQRETLVAKMETCQKEAHQLAAQLATLEHQIERQMDQSVEAALSQAATKGVSHKPSGAPTPKPRPQLQAASKRLAEKLDESSLHDFIVALQPGEQEALKGDASYQQLETAILKGGNAEEKRQLFQNFERINGSLFTYAENRFGSPYEGDRPAGSTDGLKKREIEDQASIPNAFNPRAAPTPYDKG
jgi:myosin heavy subunit